MTTEEEQKFEISYTYSYNDFKKVNFHPSTSISIIFCNIVPIIGIALFEFVMLLIKYKTGFSEMDIFLMILIPSFYLAFILLFIPTMLVIIRIQWKFQSRLPLDRKWIFNNEGLTYNKDYIEKIVKWEEVFKVSENKHNIIFFLSDNSIINIILDHLPKRALEDGQLEELYELLKKHLGAQKLKFRSFKETG